jgi:hypothetical protein
VEVTKGTRGKEVGFWPRLMSGAQIAFSQIFARGIAMVLFGLILPLAIAYNAHTRIAAAQATVEQATGTSYILELFENKHDSFDSANDYALIALADSERANLAVMINKQSMKLVVIYMGFAVMSFAMMFILLGFTDGPVDVKGEGPSIKVDLRFGSIGAAVFVIGAAMAAAGGLLKNEYKTVGLPDFSGKSSKAIPVEPGVNQALKDCNETASGSPRVECVRDSLDESLSQSKGTENAATE